MGEAFWAAREGDALLHTSFLADLVGSALEFAINAVIDFAALAVVALATGLRWQRWDAAPYYLWGPWSARRCC